MEIQSSQLMQIINWGEIELFFSVENDFVLNIRGIQTKH